MTRPDLAIPSATGRHLLLYDGLCGLCSGLVRFMVGRDRAGHVHFASLQSPVAAAHLRPLGILAADLNTLVVIVDYQHPGARALTKAAAVLFLMKTLGWPWRIAAVARVAPIGWLDRIYDVVARNRYLIAGRRDHCLVPRPDVRARFLDINERLPAREVSS
jgi:predicted DCC family thiol-disulfide oxidoreductase YuxK